VDISLCTWICTLLFPQAISVLDRRANRAQEACFHVSQFRRPLLTPSLKRMQCLFCTSTITTKENLESCMHNATTHERHGSTQLMSPQTNDALRRTRNQHLMFSQRCWVSTHHFQSPNSPDPHLERAFDTINVLQIDALPPTSSSRFSPKEKEFLGHANGVAVRSFASDVRSKSCERN
jgi:hypothetical protein